MAILRDEAVNLAAWNKFVTAHPTGNVFQTAEVYEVYRRAKRHKPGLFVVVDDKGEILAGLLACVVWEPKIPFISARSIIKGGPLWKDDVALRVLMRAYEKWASKRAIYSEIRNVFSSDNLKRLLKGWSPEWELNFISDLKLGKDALWNGLTKARRNGVTKALRLGVVTREAAKTDLNVIYKLLASTYKHARMPFADPSFFNAAFDNLVSNDLAKIWLAEVNGKAIAVMFTTLFNGVIYDWYAGASGAHLRFCPNDLLAWNATEWGTKNGYRVFDFGGAGDPDKPYGVREFKRQFGGEMVDYGRYTIVHHPQLYKLGEMGFKIYRRTL